MATSKLSSGSFLGDLVRNQGSEMSIHVCCSVQQPPRPKGTECLIRCKRTYMLEGHQHDFPSPSPQDHKHLITCNDFTSDETDCTNRVYALIQIKVEEKHFALTYDLRQVI